MLALSSDNFDCSTWLYNIISNFKWKSNHSPVSPKMQQRITQFLTFSYRYSLTETQQDSSPLRSSLRPTNSLIDYRE